MRPIPRLLPFALFGLLASFIVAPSFAATKKPVLVATPMEDLPNIYNFRLQSTYSTYLTRYSGVAVTPHVLATVAHGLFDDEALVWTSSVRRTVANNTADYSYTLGQSNIYGLQQKIWTSYASRVEDGKNDQGTSDILTFNADFAAVYSSDPLASHYAPADIAAATPYNLMTSKRSKKLLGFPLSSEIPYENQGFLHELDLGTFRFEQVRDGNDKDRMPYMVYVMDDHDSYGGNSGGPVFFKDDNNNWQVIATFLGGSGAVYVRAIDQQAHALIALADEAAGGAGAGETKPAIFYQPDDFNYEPGSALALNIAASISPATTISWYKNGALLSGKNKLVLTLDSNNPSTPGDYWMTATNAKGSATTEHITIAPYPPPAFTSQPSDTYFLAGSEQDLQIRYNSDLFTTIQWLKDGQAIPGANRYYYYVDPETNYGGTYTVKLTSTAGSTTSNPFRVGSYRFDAFDPSQPIESGATDTLKLPIYTPAEVTYRWTTPRGTLDTSIPELTIETISETDFANYQLALVAPDGNTFKTFSFATRANQPTLIHDNAPSALDAPPFERLTLPAYVTGDYTPYQIQWFHDATPIVGATDLEFTIYPFQASDAGAYHFTLLDRRGETLASTPITVQLDNSGNPTENDNSLYRFLPSSGRPNSQTDASIQTAAYNALVTQGTWLLQNRYQGYGTALYAPPEDHAFSIYANELYDIASCSWGFAVLTNAGNVTIYEDFQTTKFESLGPKIVDFAMNENGPIALQSDGTLRFLNAYRPSNAPDTHPDWQRIIRIEAEGDKLLALRSDQTLLLWNFTTEQSSILSAGQPIRDFDIAAENIPVLLEDDTILQLGHQHTLSSSPANEPAPDLRGKSPLSIHATANFTFAHLRDRSVQVWGKAPPLQPGGQALTFGNATYRASTVATARHAFALIQDYPALNTNFLPQEIVAATGDFFVARLSGPASRSLNYYWEKNGVRIAAPSHGAIYSESASSADLATVNVGQLPVPINQFANLNVHIGDEPNIYYTPTTFNATEGIPFRMPIGINRAQYPITETKWFKDGQAISHDPYNTNSLQLDNPTPADSGTYHFTTTNGLNLQSDPIEIHITPRLTFEQWTVHHGLQAPQNTWLADPDDDAHINFLEYLFDSDPLASSPLPIEYTTDGTFPVARFSLPYRTQTEQFSYELDIVSPSAPRATSSGIDRFRVIYNPATTDYEVRLPTVEDKTILFKIDAQKN